MTSRQAAAAIVVGLILIVPMAIFIRQSELVTGLYSSTGVPPVPAFAALVCLCLARFFLRRYYPRLAPTRAQVLLIYMMLTIAALLNNSFHFRAFLPHLVSLQYWGRESVPLAKYAGYLPSWYAPHDAGAIRDYYEGVRNGAVPWGVWVTPLFWWSLFWIAVFVGAFSLIFLVQRQWILHEKLSFPLLALPLAITSDDWSAYGSPAGRKLVFGSGIGIVAAFNVLNILHSLFPAVPSLKFAYSLDGLFPSRPWVHLAGGGLGGGLWIIPEAIGMGYFLPLEVSFSVWFFYLLTRFAAVAGASAGLDSYRGYPFWFQQVAGGYFAIAVFLVWGMRHTLKESLLPAFGRLRTDPRSASERWAWIGVVASTLFILGFCRVAGLSLKLAIPYFVVLGLFVLVYARIRAEAGVPFHFVFPMDQAQGMLLNAFSIPRVLGWGTRSFVIFSSLAWLSSHPIAEEQAAYQIEGVKLSEGNRISHRTLVIALLLALVAGLLAAWWVSLSAYYAMGANGAGVWDSSITGEYRARIAQWNYQSMASRISAPPPTDTPRLVAAAIGFCVVVAVSLLRRWFIGFPLHPLGFVFATGYVVWWFSILIAWFVKAAILRYGGLPLYRRGIPFFLGLVIGHLFVGGVCWPVLTLFLGRGVGYKYFLMFGT